MCWQRHNGILSVIYSPRTWTMISRSLGWTSVSTKRRDCQVPNVIFPLRTGKFLSGGRNIERRWEWAFDGCLYELYFGIRVSRIFLMSSSKFQSCSVRTNIPVAWGAKICTIPFLTWDFETTFWIFSVRSRKLIYPFVEISIFWLKIFNKSPCRWNTAGQ